MGVGYNPKIVTDGLVLCLDAANVKSYPGILGSELVTNSIITQIDGTTFNVFRDATQAFNLTLCNVEAGKTYYVDYLIPSYTGTVGATLRISNSSGNLTPTIGINAAGRFNRKFTASVSGSLTINGDNAGTDFLVDYVSVREVLSGTGLTFFDLSGNLNNGTLTNGPTFTGNSFTFDGINQSSEVSSTHLNIVWSASITRTLEIWFRFLSYPTIGNYTIWGDQASTTGTLRTFHGTDSGKFAWTWDDSQIEYSNKTMALNEWAQVVILLEGYDCTYYVNGTLDKAKFTSTDQVVTTNSIWRIANDSRFNTYVNIEVSVAKQYNRILSAAEISQNFNALRGRFGI